ncbi:MAG: hypothetical protein IK008_06975 [Bacteroidales bacterium]|nr:hypothetical protein [Bacteroidales bacterium]
MKKAIFALAACALIFASAACTCGNRNTKIPDENHDADVVDECPDGAVDLGIVMTREDGTTYRLYWAKSNLSEEGLCPNPEDYGDYYAWGETETKREYSLGTYKWCKGSGNTFTKYNSDSSFGTVDKKIVLDASDDVAHVKLGGKWRMPTFEEWTVLREQGVWIRTSQNGVNGYKLTGPNGKSIFLPAAGRRDDGPILGNAGSHGYYWSSSLGLVNPNYARRVYFSSFDVYRDFDSLRWLGFSVRPVTE